MGFFPDVNWMGFMLYISRDLKWYIILSVIFTYVAAPRVCNVILPCGVT
jgi:hypothetical protein